MEFHPNISPVDVIKKDAFGGTYFQDIYSNVTGKFYKNSWKEFKELKDINGRCYCSNGLIVLLFYCSINANLNCYSVKVETSLRF